MTESLALRVGAMRGEETKILMQTFCNIADKWELSIDEQLALLGHPARSTYFKWKKEGGMLPCDTEDRISFILGIYKALRIKFTDDEAADSWVRKPNLGPLFGDKSALDLMSQGGFKALFDVRRYLDAQRGGWS